MTILKACLAALALLAAAFAMCSSNQPVAASTQEELNARAEAQETTKEPAMLVQYLEIVSSDVDATCSALAKVHGVTFGKPDAGLGNARTAALEGGGRIGVRAPMGEHEQSVVRPYALVDDVETSVAAAKATAEEIAMPATEIPGHGTFAIYFLGGIQHGLWGSPAPAKEAKKEKALPVHYLEIVSSNVDATCSTLAKVHGVTFSEPDPVLGNARTAALAGGGRIGVRAPMAAHEQPVVRPYALVDDIEAAVKTAEEAGGTIAMPATPIPGGGKFAIYFLGGAQFGLWEI